MSKKFEFGNEYYRSLRGQGLVLVDMDAIERSISSGAADEVIWSLMDECKLEGLIDGELVALYQRAIAGWLLRAGISTAADSMVSTRAISTSPSDNAPKRRACRVLTMVHELHKVGYQRIRIAGGMSPNGCHWRCHITTADNIQLNGWEPIDWKNDVVNYTTGEGDQFFGWPDASGKNARQLAQMFLGRFPNLARKGAGRDRPYAGWFVEMLGAAENDLLPIFFADYDIEPVESEMPPPPLGICMARPEEGGCSG